MAFKHKLAITLTVILVAAVLSGGVYYLYIKEALMIRNPVLVQEKPVITYMNGEVYFKASSQEEWQEPELGQNLKQGTLLKTGADGELDIRINGESLIRMDRDSILKLEKSTLRNMDLSLEEGVVYGRFHKLFSEQNLQVKTPAVTAGIRGTDLVFEHRDSETTVYALSGITEVYNPGFPADRLLLSFQRKTTVKKGAPPAEPVQMSGEEITGYQNILNAIHKETVLLVTRAIQFKPNSPEILDSSKDELERLYNQISKTKYTLQINGHTADIGNAGAQLKLSLERARAVKDYLVNRGINEKRLRIEGYGGSQPVADNRTEEGKARNRRVEFVIVE